MRKHCVWHWQSSCVFSIRREPSLPAIDHRRWDTSIASHTWHSCSIRAQCAWKILARSSSVGWSVKISGHEYRSILKGVSLYRIKTGASVPSGVSDGIAVRCEYLIASAGLFWFGTNDWAKIICFLPRKDSIVPAQIEISPWFKWSCFSSCSSMNFSSRKS